MNIMRHSKRLEKVGAVMVNIFIMVLILPILPFIPFMFKLVDMEDK